VNRNGLDNRRANLRLATRSENLRNRAVHCNNTSGYRGVRWKPARRKWVANITLNGQQHHLGYHATPEAAHQAYCAAARELHGEFARTG